MAAVAIQRPGPAVSTPRRDGKRRSRVESQALTILKEIPGVPSKNALRNWLYVARTVFPDEEAYTNIRTYIRNSQEHGFGIKMLNAVRICRKGALEFEHDQEKSSKFRMMLWHGTKNDCIAKILQHGMAPPPNRGQMFGTGIYFADRASKSAQYCPQTAQPSRPQSGTVGYLLLCDVLVGNMFNAKQARNGATAPPSYTTKRGQVVHCDSVRCTGQWVPNRERQEEIGGVVWPLGETVRNGKFDSYTVRYNEFIVYNPENVKPKYIVKVQFLDLPYMY